MSTYIVRIHQTNFDFLSRLNSKKYSGNKIEIKIELTYAFSNRIPVWESGRSSVMKKKVLVRNF